MATSLPCENGGGSLNNPNGSPTQIGTNNASLIPYSVPVLPVGTMDMTGINPSLCQNTDQQRQELYVAESLNISGAPINIFKLLGNHEQGGGSVLSRALIVGSAAYPGYPLTGINNSSAWRSLQMGSGISGVAYVGADFGIKTLTPTGTSEYEPNKQKWTTIGAISITQSNSPDNFAKQVKVETTDGPCETGSPQFSGVGNGTLSVTGNGSNVSPGYVSISATSSTTFSVVANLSNGTMAGLGTATVGVPFFSTFINFTISAGTTPFNSGDLFTVPVSYVWKRVGIFNIVQSPLPQTLNLKVQVLVKAIRVTPTLFTGTGSWEVLALDFLDSAPTDINNIQDLFFNENRDRDYALEPVMLKVQYNPTDSSSDLAKFGLSILDQYTFMTSYVSMVKVLGRPLVTGDIIEVIPEMQWDQNLLPVRKFLEVVDTGWAAEGFSTFWRPTVYRFTAQQALPSQETRDIFGTMDTQKYLMADAVLDNGVGEQISTLPLTQMEEILKSAEDRVPETGSDDLRSIAGIPIPRPARASNKKGNPAPATPNSNPNLYIESGLPPGDAPYGEGFVLPTLPGPADGDYFRLYYPPETSIPARLYRFSLVKNRWIYMETDRRSDYSSHKPAVRGILQSPTQQSLNKKTT